MSTIIKDLGPVSAYAYAVTQGYTGTEEEFAALMADYADVGQRAEDAAESALDSKTAAQTAAQTATSKASEASTSATSASGSASAASASASQASGSATNAANSATAASESATSAAGSATTASTKASEASASATAAQTAQTAAEAAQTAAETAQGKAEDAQEAAETTAQSISASAAQIATNAADITQLKSEVSVLPTDGVVANSKQLLSENGTDNAEPYLFRAAPVNADRAELDAVVGGTVVWNQLAVDRVIPSTTINGITWTNNNDGTFTANGTATGDSYIDVTKILSGLQNHIILFSGCPAGGGSTTWEIFQPYITHTITRDTGNGRVSKTTSANAVCRLYVFSGATANNIKFIPQFFDLTAMFGSTIADYIYQLEQSTAGAGVAFFRKLFPKDYYPYDAGTLKSVEGVSSHETVGFNQWDEEWEEGAMSSSTGLPVTLSGRIRSKNHIRVFQNTTYYVKVVSDIAINFYFYDANQVYMGASYQVSVKNATLTIPSGAYYAKFNTATGYGGTYKNDICINLSDPAKNGTYEPYVKYSYPLDSDVTLRGIPKLADGKLYYDGDRYLPDGTVERQYGIRSYQSGDESLTDVITDGTNTVYKLTTMTIEESTPYRQLQICDPNGTEEFVSTGIVPVGHETRYPENLRAKIEGLPWDFSSLIAPTEKTTTASRNYTTGSLLIMNNVLYKVTANIANGGTITVGTNATATTLSEVISALQ